MFFYIYAKVLKKLKGNANRNFKMQKGGCIGSGNHLIDVSMGRYSYLGDNCEIINCSIGNFCSLSNNIMIGNSEHSTTWISTSPFFLKNKTSKKLKKYSNLSFTDTKKTLIGNDVWIGSNVQIKQGVKIGNGVVIGMGSIVTKDIDDFSIVAGNPAKLIRYRFTNEICELISESNWWDMPTAYLETLVNIASNPKEFVSAVNKIRIQN